MAKTSPSLIKKVSRRRFIQIVGTGTGVALFTPSAALAREKRFEWNGLALGAAARMFLVGQDRNRSAKLCKLCLNEIDRLEKIFSLFRPGSSIRRLNRSGRLPSPPQELVEVTRLGLRLSKLTEGAFDISIQPLWQYLFYLCGQPIDNSELDRRKSLVNYKKIHVSDREIRFEKQGMQITLNGIAQGYICDRVTELLRQEGLSNALVQLGESYGLGRNEVGIPWQLGILPTVSPNSNPQLQQESASTNFPEIIELENMALATSSGSGTPFHGTPDSHHLLDARSGESSSLFKILSVVSPKAATADGLSTALSLTPQGSHQQVLAHFPETRVIFS